LIMQMLQKIRPTSNPEDASPFGADRLNYAW
jgi:hypothetical protein